MYSGLLGAFQASKEYKLMLKELRPLINNVNDLDFSSDFVSTLRDALVFTRPKNIILTTTLIKNENDIKTLIKSSPTETAILIQTIYKLDYSYTTFTINSDLSVWNKKSPKPLHKSKIVYSSKPVTFDHSLFVRSRALPLWIANGGENYRIARKEGISKSADLVNTSLTENEDLRVINNEYTFYDYTDQKVKHGRLLNSDRHGRPVIRKGSNDYYSIPSAEPTYASIYKKIKAIPEGKSRLYVFRPAGGSWYQPDLVINGKKYNPVYIEGFYYVDLLPGKYTLTLDQDSNDTALSKSLVRNLKNVKPLAVNLVDNQEYYLKFAFHPGLFGHKFDFEIVPRDIAVNSINNMQYKGDVP
jgi:hypothetical protein